LKSLPR